MDITKDKKEKLGHCSFCSGDEHKKYKKVYELQSSGTSIRICSTHIKQIKKECK